MKGLLKYPGFAFDFLLKHKKISIPSIIAIVVLVYFFFPKSPSNVLTAKVVRKDIVKSVSVTGDIAADRATNLTFQTTEVLSYVGVNVGDSVTKGEEIAALNQNKLQATFRQAQQDFVAAKAASQQYYDNHTNSTESDEEKVQRTAIDATQNKAYDQMLKTQYDLNHSALFAPFDGIVTRMDAKNPGTTVTPATIFTVVDPTSLYFNMEVDQTDVGLVKNGQDVNISLDAFPDKKLMLEISSIDFVSHTTSSGGNAFYVKASLPENSSYRVGLSGNADIIVDSKNDVLSVPSSSIFNDSYVYAQSNKKFVKTKVKTGIANDIDVEIVSGLSEGESVALDPTSVPQNQISK